MPDSPSLTYCPDPYHYQRRDSRVVTVGRVAIGGENPIRVQSMLTSNTLDTEACVVETLGLVEAGCEIVRVTAQTRRHAANLEHIKSALVSRGVDVPLVADIHFKPDAAMEAAKWVEKVRVNPGNFVDSKKFAVREYSDEQYEEELERIRERFHAACRALHRARGGDAHRHEPRFPERPHHEPVWRHAARHGGECARVCAYRPGSRTTTISCSR